MAIPNTEVHRRIFPLVLSIAGGLVVTAALLLWAHYGTAVFLDVIRAGYAMCFG
jgi:hypothetical protein